MPSMEEEFFSLPSPSSVSDAGPGWSPGEPRPWAGPGTSRPEVVHDLSLTLAESDIARVILERVNLYPAGRVLDIAATIAAPSELQGEDELRAWRNRTMATIRPVEGRLADELLRIGVRLSNGRKATWFDDMAVSASEPDRPVLMDISGAGYRAKGSQILCNPSLWLWPAITNEFELVVEWPAFGIALTAVELE